MIIARAARVASSCALLLAAACGSGAELDDGRTASPLAPNARPDGSADGVSEIVEAELGPVELCETRGATVAYAPQGGRLDVFPDDYFTNEENTPTGRRVTLASSRLSLPDETRVFHGVYDELSRQDGFGVTSQLFVRFGARLDPSTLPPSGPESASLESSVLLFALGTDPVEPVAFEWELVDDSSTAGSDQTLLLSPLRALDEQKHYALAITTALRSSDGDCIAPSETMGALLEGRANGFDHVRGSISRLVGALERDGVIRDAGELTLGVTFHTQTISDESVAFTETVRRRPVRYRSTGPCQDDGAGMLICEGRLDAVDFRGEDGVIDLHDLADPLPTELSVTAWVPSDADGPFQTLIFGHGLGSGRSQGEFLAAQVVPPRAGKTRAAVIAVDAPMHGEHPDCAERFCPAILPFFGAETVGLELLFEGRRFRDNLRQANLDKQHLVQAILDGLDVTGDGSPDFDSSAIHYVGASLGGIMGGEFAAMTPELENLVLLVPGARLIDVVRELDVAPLLFGSATEGDLARLYPVLQTAFDKGDPGAHARSILGQRARGTATDRPHVLMQVALGDRVVPNRTSVFFARNLGLAVVGDPVVAVPGQPLISELPVSANVENRLTAGLYGFDIICADQTCNETETGNHASVAYSHLASIQAAHFVDTWIATGVPEIIDIYRTEGVK